MKVVYRRYASLFFIAGMELDGEVRFPLSAFVRAAACARFFFSIYYFVYVSRMSWVCWNSSMLW